MKYLYPAIFTPESVGYSVRFPDIENCFTSGQTIQEAVEMAQDVLNLMLWDMEDRKKAVQSPSVPTAFTLEQGEFVAYFAADTTEYRRKMDS